MRFDDFLSSRVARRIFALFIACALVPLAALALVSFGQVSSQLYAHGEDRLEAGVRAAGQGIIERLLMVEAELRLSLRPGQTPRNGGDLVSVDATPRTRGQAPNPFERQRLRGIARVRPDGVDLLGGTVSEPLLPGDDAIAHLAAGGTALLVRPVVSGQPIVQLAIRSTPDNPDSPLLLGEVDSAFLWAGGEDTLPRNNQLCVLGPGRETLFCTRPADGVLPASFINAVSASPSGALEWSLDGDEYLGAHWQVPLAYQFAAEPWTVVLSESRADILAPMATFRYFFPLVVLMSLWVVMLLSIVLIRKSLDPLKELREGTRRIADRDFESRVDVESGDEFEDLARSFNNMAGRLGKQFNALATMAEIDRTVLSTLDIEKIVSTVLRHTSDLIDCHALSVTLVSPDQQRVPRTYTLRNTPNSRPWVETTFFDDDVLQRFSSEPDRLELGPGDGTPGFLSPLARTGSRHFLVLPMFIGGDASGAITLGFADTPTYDDDDLGQARQLANQVAVALANAHLLEDLDSLNWGTLTALARTVDAKSPWTAGHSERVTAMGIKIGKKMNLGKEEIAILQRGGLLHDLGKVGIPAAILDKPGKLTDEEYEVMKRHPEIGATILQPIAAYAEAIPIVRQHHERWDGSGYPDGLAETQIHLYARIFAVADVFDALVSDRPYRGSLSHDEVVRTIVDGDGTEFDPEVVAAFLEVMTDEGFGTMNETPPDQRAELLG